MLLQLTYPQLGGRWQTQDRRLGALLFNAPDLRAVMLVG